MINQERIYKIFENFNSHTDDYLGAMFINIFNKLPNCYRIYFKNDKTLTYNSTIDEFEDIKIHTDYKIDIRKIIKNACNEKNNIKVFCYSQYEYLILGEENDNCFLINITLNDLSDIYSYYEEVFTNNIEYTFNIIKDWFEISTRDPKIEFGIANIDQANCIYTSWYEYKTFDLDIKKNYNDDIPYDKICNIIEDEGQSALMLFYGEPGTGKSSLIKHFINKYPDKDFVFIDSAILINTSQKQLMAYFLECENTIFILEDCEKALMNREHYINPVMPTLLNITDGIIGDVLGIKLICTFNTSLKNIDPALVRKGRLSLKYEFKKLSADKIYELSDHKISKEMTLADIYHNDEENDYSKQNTKKIGF